MRVGSKPKEKKVEKKIGKQLRKTFMLRSIASIKRRLKPHLHTLKNRHGTPKFRHRADDLSARHFPFTRLYQEIFYDLSTVLAIILAPLKSCSCVSRSTTSPLV